MINSKQKGKNGELEWSNICKKQGYNTRRSQQFCGSNPDSADVVGIPGIHMEIKRVEKLNIDKAMKQAKQDANGNEFPIVAHRKNNEEWLVTMRASDWFELLREWHGKDELVQK